MNIIAPALWLSGSLALAQAPEAPEAPLAITDFAYTMALEPTGEGPVHTVELPLPVHEGLTRPDLGDLRVFSADGTEVPHAVRRMDRGTRQTTSSINLPFSPLWAQPGGNDPDLSSSVTITRSDDGETITFAEKAVPTGPSPQRVGYLVDASALKQSFIGLEVELDPSEGDLTVPVFLAGSADLGTWIPYGLVGHLVRVRIADQMVERTTLTFPSFAQPYLQLSFGEAGLPVEITTLHARLPDAQVAATSVETEVVGTLDPDDPEVVHFDLGSPALPVDTLQLRFPETHTLISGTLSASTAPGGPWSLVKDGTFFRMEREGVRLDGPMITVNQTGPQHWRFKAEAKGGGLGGQLPSLQITRHPDQLLFLAKGSPPFTLAYGSHKARPSDFSHTEILAFLSGEGQQASQASLGPERVEGGESARTPPPPPEPSKLPTILLWAVLIGGVGMLLVFVRRLMAEMKSQD